MSQDPSPDDAAIRNLVARLAQLADGGSLEEYVNLFTADAYWEMPGSAGLQGQDALRSGAIERRAAGGVGPGTNTRHVITTQAVIVDDNEAVSYSYWQFWTNTTTNPTVTLMGNYEDRLVRTADGWKLANRKIVFG